MNVLVEAVQVSVHLGKIQQKEPKNSEMPQEPDLDDFYGRCSPVA
jgi:hypothetical protein